MLLTYIGDIIAYRITGSVVILSICREDSLVFSIILYSSKVEIKNIKEVSVLQLNAITVVFCKVIKL
jgi:hypothetical protein